MINNDEDKNADFCDDNDESNESSNWSDFTLKVTCSLLNLLPALH